MLKSLINFLAGSGSIPTADSSGSRSTVDFPEVIGRDEIKAYDRKAVNKKAKHLMAKSGLLRSMGVRLARYCTPMIALPSSGDEEWDAEAEVEFHTWALNPIAVDVANELNFYRMQNLAVTNMFRSGELFFHLVSTLNGNPSLQLFDDTQVGGQFDFGSLGNIRAERFRDGIEYDSLGRKMNFAIRDKLTDSPILIPSNRMVHLYDPERVGQGRGISWFYAGVDSAIDILDITALEKGAEKLHAALAAVVKTKSGTDNGVGLVGKFAAGSKGTNRPAIEEINGVNVRYLNTDEELILQSSNRPSATWLGFMDFLIKDVAWSFGLPPEFVWAMAGLGGPGVRAVLEDSQSFFDEVEDIMATMAFNRIYSFVIATKMKLYRETNGKRGLRPPADPKARWWEVQWMGPPKVTIDNGRDTKADVQRLEKGLMSHDEYWLKRQRNPNAMMRREFSWLKRAMELSKETGVPMEYFLQVKHPAEEKEVNRNDP
jgi:capsid protein